LTFINNEIQHDKNEDYKSKFMSLNKLMLVEFGADGTLFPKETA